MKRAEARRSTSIKEFICVRENLVLNSLFYVEQVEILEKLKTISVSGRQIE